MNSNTAPMTRGPIYKQIITFALPIFWGQFFQQMYNIVDSIVVGNFVGKHALAAVSSSGSLVQLLVGFFIGVFVGAGVVISKYYGAGNGQYVRLALHTTTAFALAAGTLLTALGVIFSPQVLIWMGTPGDVLSEATTYLRIYFGGALSLALFNSASGLFQALGDSKHPLYYLIVASLTNVVLDLLFVAVLRIGIAGAAIATVISQTLGVILAFRRLCSAKTEYRIIPSKIRFHRDLLTEILRTGLPAGVQNCVISFANVVVQSNINTFGSTVMAGFGASNKVEGFVFIPITSFAMALTTYVSQNLGAKEYGRARAGARFGIISCCAISQLIGLIYYFTAPFLVQLFNQEPAVVAAGTAHARIIAFFFCLLSFSHCAAGVLRGAGRAVVPMLIMFMCWCVFRVTYITIATSYIPDIRVVYWAYPITWTMTTVFLSINLVKSDWIHGLEQTSRRHLPHFKVTKTH